MADDTGKPVNSKPAEDDGWIDVPALTAPTASATDDSGWQNADAPKTPYNPDAPEAFPAPAGDPVSRFGQGLWANTGAALGDAGKAIWDLMNVAGGDKKHLDPATMQIGKNIIEAHKNQWQEAQKAWDQGDHTVAAGHALATILPLVGPAAAHAAERMSDFKPAAYDKYGNVLQSGQSPDIAGGLGEGTGLLAPSVAARIPGVVQAGVKAIPDFARAGTLFDRVTNVAGHLPIDVNAPGQAALDIQRLAKSGGVLPKVVNDFLKRVTDPKQSPLTFSEARDFYTNASRLSADEFNRLTPVMQRAVGGFRASLDSSLTDAASQAGMGDVYRSAMEEWRRAAKLKGIKSEIGDVAKSSIGKGIGIGAGTTLGGWLYNKLWGKAEGGLILDRNPSRESILASLNKGH